MARGKMKKLVLSLILACIGILSAVDCYAIELSKHTMSGRTEESQLSWYLYYLADIPSTSVFNNFYIDQNTPDQTLISSAMNDPAFDLFTSYMTNGQNDIMRLTFSEPTGSSFGGVDLESAVFSGSQYRLNGIDFEGWEIDSYELRVLNVQSIPFTSVLSYSAEFVVNGHMVPEPISSVLMLIGGGAMALRRKWNKSLFIHSSCVS